MMGSSFSKKTGRPQGNAGGSNGSSSEGSGSNSAAVVSVDGSHSSNSSKIEYMRELSSYESACQQDPELQSFDSTLQQRTVGAISIIARSEMSSLSLDTLRQVTGCLLDSNQEVVKMILEYKKDIWKNPELFNLVEEYFENSLQTLDFCTALEKCLMKARDSQLFIQVALQRFAVEENQSEAEEEETDGQEGNKKYKRTLEELQHFKAAGDPFTEEFFRVFQSVYRQQVSMLGKLQQRKRKLDKKLKTLKAWRRVSNIIFVSAFAAVLICSVVTAVMAAPPVAAALAAAASIPLGSMGKWIDSLWKDYSNVVEGEKEMISTMEVGTYVAISDLDGIRVLVDRLEMQISYMLQNVNFAVRDEDTVKLGIEEIKKKLGFFMKSIEDLGKQVDRCSRDIQRARTVVLQRFIRHPK